MPKKRYTAEEIIHKLREAGVLLSQGKTVSQACKQLGVSDQTYYRWRKIYGGMKVDQAKRLKKLPKLTLNLDPLRRAGQSDSALRKRRLFFVCTLTLCG